MAVAVGSITCPTDRSIRFEAFSHNTIRGAAGGVIYLAELAHDGTAVHQPRSPVG